MLQLLCVAVLVSITNASEVGYFQREWETKKTRCTYYGETTCSEDCLQVVLCKTDGADGFEEFPVDSCNSDAGQLCGQGACGPVDQSDCSHPSTTTVVSSTTTDISSTSDVISTTSPVSTFHCNDLGAFPDPRVCTIVYFCEGADAKPLTIHCNGSWAYNPLTYDCSLPLDHRVCQEGPVPDECVTPGQRGVLPENPAIYYECDDQLIPQMYRCHHGKVYDPTTDNCVDPSESTTPNPTTSDTTSTSEYTELSSTEETISTSSSPTDNTADTDSPLPTGNTPSTSGSSSTLSTTPLDSTSASVTKTESSLSSTTAASSSTPEETTSESSSTLSTTSPDSTSVSDTTTQSSLSSTTAASSSTPEEITSESSSTLSTTSPDSTSVSDTTTESSLSSTTADSSNTPEEITTTIGSTSTMPPPPIEGDTCDQPDQKVPDPYDCHSFYLCLGIWFHIRCTEGYHFDVVTGECVHGDC